MEKVKSNSIEERKFVLHHMLDVIIEAKIANCENDTEILNTLTPFEIGDSIHNWRYSY